MGKLNKTELYSGTDMPFTTRLNLTTTDVGKRKRITEP